MRIAVVIDTVKNIYAFDATVMTMVKVPPYKPYSHVKKVSEVLLVIKTGKSSPFKNTLQQESGFNSIASRLTK